MNAHRPPAHRVREQQHSTPKPSQQRADTRPRPSATSLANLLLAGIVALTGCGDSSSNDTDTDTTGSAESTSSTTDATTSGVTTSEASTTAASSSSSDGSSGAETTGAIDCEPDLIVHNAAIYTQDVSRPEASAIAVADGVICAVGEDAEIVALQDDDTVVLDGEGRRMIPGLNDNHLHAFSAGHDYNYNVRWDGVPTLELALQMLAEQAKRTPKGQWVKAIGGWSPRQFAEGRMPTIEELDAAVPDHPVMVQFAYNIALMNAQALAAVGAGTDAFYVPEGTILEQDADGQLTGRIIGDPASWLFWVLEYLVPQPTPDERKNALQQMFKEFNRVGLTSFSDAGASEIYPNTPSVAELREEGNIPLRVSFMELPVLGIDSVIEATTVTAPVAPGENIHPSLDYGYTFEGVGELVYMNFQGFETTSDWENFTQPTHVVDPDFTTEKTIEEVTKLVQARIPFRNHVTYNENAGPMLDGIEAVNAMHPLDGLRWSIEHAETISATNIERVRALGGGIAVQGRMALHGDDFIDVHGAEAAAYVPPMRAMLDAGVPFSLGTDGLRAATFNPWLTLYWATTGRTVSGQEQLAEDNRLSREEALHAYTLGSAWHQFQEDVKGRLAPGQLADFILLSDDYFTVPDEDIRTLHSVLTVVGGGVVHGEGAYERLAPVVPDPIPDWSPVHTWPGYYQGE